MSPGFVETHIHLDKSCILDRCRSERGDLEEAIAEAAKAKAAFTPEDVHSRAVRTLEKAILQGTTHMRTHLEVDPGVGLRGLEGVLPLVKEYSWMRIGPRDTCGVPARRRGEVSLGNQCRGDRHGCSWSASRSERIPSACQAAMAINR